MNCSSLALAHRTGDAGRKIERLRDSRKRYMSRLIGGSALVCSHTRDYNWLMASVGIRDLKAHASDIVERAEAGEAFLVTRRGKPVAVVLPFGIEAEDLILARASAFIKLREEGRTELRKGTTVGWESLKLKVQKTDSED